MQVLSLSHLSAPRRPRSRAEAPGASPEPSFARAGEYELLDTPFRDPLQVRRIAPGDAELHTRLTLLRPAASVLVHWEVAHDARFRRLERYGLFFVHAQRDYLLRIVVSGLEPGHGYWARLWAGGTWSARVRVRTESHAHRRPQRPVLHALG